MHYPLDDKIQNRGRLTLIHPEYCSTLFAILGNMKNVIANKGNTNAEIPNKDKMIANINKGYVSVEVNDVSKIVEMIKTRKALVDLTCDEMRSLVCELIG